MPQELTIGRTDENDITLPHPYLSSTHAAISLIDKDNMLFHIRDMDSTNGTFKNGVPVSEADFELGDKIQLGNYELQTADFLDYFVGNEVASSGKSSVKTTSSLFSKVTIVVLLASTLTLAYLLLSGTAGAGKAVMDGGTIIQALAVFLLVLLSIQLVQAFYRYSAQLRSEKQFRQIMLERWNRESQTLLAEHEAKAAQEETGWQGFRKFEIVNKVVECDGITSFYLQPHDKHALPAFKPGQYLTFRLKIPGQDRDVIRCYSLSDSFHDDYYRVSIKKVPPPPKQPDLPWGLSSSYFHDQLEVGSILDVKAPSGKFCLDLDRDTGVVLIAGGVGLTPMVSMLNSLVEMDSKRDIWFFYGVRHSAEIAMHKHLLDIEKKFPNVHLQLVFSEPKDSEQLGTDYQHKGYVSIDLFKQMLPSNNYEYYMCGPPPMMQSVAGALSDWGVPEADVHFEAFGPATVKKKKDGETAETMPNAEVVFSRSGKTVTWDGSSGNPLLVLAEESGVDMAFACRAGSCGTCETAIRKGKVKYDKDPDFDVEDGSCLPCVCRPDGNVELDA